MSIDYSIALSDSKYLELICILLILLLSSSFAVLLIDDSPCKALLSSKSRMSCFESELDADAFDLQPNILLIVLADFFGYTAEL